MKKISAFVFALIVLGGAPMWCSADGLDDYKQTRKSLAVEDRLSLAVETLQIGEDDSARVESIRDLLRYSLSLDKNEEALETVEKGLEGRSKDTEMWGRLQLAKGRLLTRLGKTEEGMALLKQGVVKHWKENAFWEINDALMETGQRALLAVDEYDRNMGDEYSKETRESYAIGSDLAIFFIRLLEMKQAKPDLNAMENVYPQLKESSWRKYAHSSAQALCLAADRRFEEARTVLVEIESEMEKNFETLRDSEELKFHPLHKAFILFYENKEPDSARKALQQYMDAFPEAPQLPLNRCLDFVYCLDNNGEDCKKIAEVTQFFIEHPVYKDPKTLEKVPRDRIASVYDKHSMSLSWRGQFEEAASYDLYVMSEYPDTLAGCNCAMNYARYIGWSKNDIDGAETIYQGLLEENRHESQMPWVRFALAELFLKRNDSSNALLLIDEILKQEFSPIEETGSRIRNVALELKIKIEETINVGQ